MTTLAAEVFPVDSFPNKILAGVAVTAAMPVPSSVTLCGLLLELSVIARLPDRKPGTVGSKTAEIVQVAPA